MEIFDPAVATEVEAEVRRGGGSRGILQPERLHLCHAHKGVVLGFHKKLVVGEESNVYKREENGDF